MNYPEKFQQALIAEFPKDKELKKMLKRGSVDVGEFLEYAGNIRIWMTPNQIVRAINKGRTDDVKKAAQKSIRIRKLCRWWQKIFDENPPGFVEVVTGYPPEQLK